MSGRAPNDRRLIDGLVGYDRNGLPVRLCYGYPGYFQFDHLCHCTSRHEEANLYDNLLSPVLTQPMYIPLLLAAIERTLVTNLQPIPATGQVFTDDRAPIEWLTNNMVLSFVLFGDMSGLQGETQP